MKYKTLSPRPLLDERASLRAGRTLNIFCMKSEIDGHKIHQLGTTVNANRFDLIQVKLASLSAFMKNILGTSEACSFSLGRL